MITDTDKINLEFLDGGGETGRLIFNHNWEDSPLGSISQWPESLCTTLGIMLHSSFPMFLFWGEDLICFYNDAFSTGLDDNGKHPAIGKKGSEVWKENWDFVGPLIHGVIRNAKPAWFEDQPLTFTRNGRREETFWTFSCSAAYVCEGRVHGVVVTGTETTSSVLAKKILEERERKLRSIITQAPVSIAIFLGRDYITETANSRALELWGRKEEEVLHKPILKAMPELKEQGMKELLDDVYIHGRVFTAAELPVQIQRNGKLETAYINFSYEPIHDPGGNIEGVMAVGTEVTQQVFTHRKVQENEEKLNIVVEASELGTFELDLNTDTMQCSKRFKAIFDYDDTKEADHTIFLDQIYPEDLAVRNDAFIKALKTGILNYRSRIKTVNESCRWIEVKGKVFYDKKRMPKMVIGTCGDITGEKQYRKDLEESEQKFRILADSMPQHIWTADAAGNLNYFNQSVYDYAGLTPVQLAEVGWLEIVHPDDREKNVATWLESINTGKDFLFEHRFRRHDGTYRWQLSRALPQKDSQGKIDRWVGTSTDIQEQKDFAVELERKVSERTTELIALNKTLKASEERYHLMVAEVQDYAILYLNKEGTVQNWNMGAEKIKGYKAEEIVGRNFSNFYTEQDRRNKLPQKLLQLAARNARAGQEGWRVKKDGSLFWANVVITAVHNSENELIGFSKVTHDLTRKKEADDILMHKKMELEEKNTELEKMNKELQSFAYISSHDLQEPLRKIQTFASLIVEKELGNLSASGKDLFARMQRSAERMQALIDDLLVYSRTHNTERNFEKINLNDILNKVAADLKEEIQQKGAILQTTKGCDIEVIPFQFQQVFYNLISNALKFSRTGVPPEIQISSEFQKGLHAENNNLKEDKSYCHITITDNGIGFEPQYVERIFELFQRLHGKEQYPGTGIGLAIVKKIVENHNGIITASGEPGKGARFDIFIPESAT